MKPSSSLIQSGYSFIELMLVLIIVSVVVSLSMPIWHLFFNIEKAKVLQTNIEQALLYAKLNADTSKTAVIVNKIAQDWSKGYQIYHDTFDDGKVHDAKQIIKIEHFKGLKGQLHWRSFSQKNFIRFAPDMLTNDNGSFWFCADNKKQVDWVIVVNKAGRIRKSDEFDQYSC